MKLTQSCYYILDVAKDLIRVLQFALVPQSARFAVSFSSLWFSSYSTSTAVTQPETLYSLMITDSKGFPHQLKNFTNQ